MSTSRRDFLKDSFLAGAVAALGSGTVLAKKAQAVRKAPASEQLRVAVVGVRGRGCAHVDGYLNNPYCTITTICDADKADSIIGPPMKKVEQAQGQAPKFEQDIRRVVADKNIDIISIATPNHWHALAAIWALQNGKDVYVEKPVSHNVSEGRRIVEAAHKYNRICQAGTQSRSSKGMRDAIAFLHEGKLGKIRLARGLCYKLRGSIGKVKGPQQPPSTMDYDLWCGPAPYELPRRKNVHYDWHWIWNYGNGDLGNQGIHEMDKARWGLNKNELPRGVYSLGGRFGYIDDGETANTQICVFDYGDCELIFEVRGRPSASPFPGKASPKTGLTPTNFVGNVYYGTEGFLVCPNYTGGVAYSNDGEILRRFSGGEAHFDNFIKAVRSRKESDLNGHILEGHLSSALCHLGNISYRLGTLTPFDKKTNAFGDDKDAADAFESMKEHLKTNSIALDGLKYHLGRKLKVDPSTETFLGDRAANAMLTREYRKGFEVPEKL